MHVFKDQLRKVIATDIRIWIVIFFIGRLYGITNPPLETPVTWRECDGVMIARNFYEVDNNIFYPRVDVAGEKTGIVGSEFPILNYLIYLLSLPFGFHDWFGRLINLIISSLAIFYYTKIISKYFGEAASFYSGFAMLVSMWFAYSRIIIPDIFGASLGIIAIYFSLLYFENGNIRNYLLLFFLASTACLSKISASSLLTVLILPMLSHEIPMKQKIAFSIAALIIFLIVCVWYFYWVPYLNTHFEFEGHFFMGQSIVEGIKQLIDNWQMTLYRFYERPVKYSGFIVFLVSLISLAIKRKTLALLAFAVPFLAYIPFVFVSGWAFNVNSYYPIMMVASMTLVIGVGLSGFKNKFAYSLVAIMAIEGIAGQYHLFRIRDFMKPYTQLESLLQNSGVQKNDLIAVNSGSRHDPTPMYFTHRKGWGVSNEELENEDFLNDLRKKGCKFVVVLKIGDIMKIELPLKKARETETCTVYRLNP